MTAGWVGSERGLTGSPLELYIVARSIDRQTYVLASFEIGIWFCQNFIHWGDSAREPHAANRHAAMRNIAFSRTLRENIVSPFLW